MQKIEIYKAQRVGKQEVGSLLIKFSEAFPPTGSVLADRETFEEESKKLEFLLYHVLPGGTYDRLLVLMLKRRASRLAVAYGGLDAD